MELLPFAAPIIGGLLGGSKSQGQSSTQTSQIDPRLADAIYGKGGSIPAAQEWFTKNRTGLNPQMQQGLGNQALQLASSKGGFDQMQNLGLGLMSGGVAGNPFSQGYSGGTNFGGSGPSNTAGGNQPIQQMPQGMPQAYTPAIFDQQQPAASPAVPVAPIAPPQQISQEIPEWLTHEYRSKNDVEYIRSLQGGYY